MMMPSFTMGRINLLAAKYGTDKIDHGYLKYYHEWLNGKNHEDGFTFKHKKMLEIGCLKGASLHMWNELFYGQVQIHTIDLFATADTVNRDTLHKLGYVTYQGDQSDIPFLYSIREMFDFIIDDGSHNSDHQAISFKHLFLNNLCSGGIYVIEDLHCCKEPFYWNGAVDRVEDTMLGVLTNYIGPTKFFSETEWNLFFNPQTGIVKYHAVYNDKIAFLVRR